jgi:hypothetical protein
VGGQDNQPDTVRLLKVNEEIKRCNTMDDTEWTFYLVYRSKYNRESIDTLKYGMTFQEFVVHSDFIYIHEDLEEASTPDPPKGR